MSWTSLSLVEKNSNIPGMELNLIATKHSGNHSESKLIDKYEFVTSIDIGTIYSGYAYAHINDVDLNKENFNIKYRQAWNSGNPNLISNKTPTALLLDENQQIISFGYDAENKYMANVANKQTNYYFFRRFKMILYEKVPTPDMLLNDINNKQLSATTVFSNSILALKNDFFDCMKRQGIMLRECDVRWVVTVPAIWSDGAKQFMRQCANQAGIPNEQLIIALEPEAASIYCQFVKSKELQDAHLTVTKIGTQYMVVDLGGGTVDITVHEKMENGYLKEIHSAKGADCGGNSINESLVNELIRNFGGPLMTQIRTTYPSVYFEVHREFEAAKKTFDPSSNNPLSLRVPHMFLDVLWKTMSEESILETVKFGPHGSGVEINQSSINISAVLIKANLFQPTTDKILQLMTEIISKINSERLTKILLVGGLSDSIFIQNSIRSAFPDKHLIVPEDAGLCVVKGAVMFGRHPDLISHRVVRYTYGVRICPLFNPTQHEVKRKIVIEGKERCSDVFMKYVKIGTVIEVNKNVMKYLYTIYPFQKVVEVSVCVSTSESPKYVDEDGCSIIGSLKVNVPNPSKEYRSFEVSLVFGNTELHIHAKDVLSGKQCKTSLDFVIY